MIDPSNLWLTVHESVGHATEYDRAIGYEAAYAGTSFATPDQLGTLRYASEHMHVTGDRTVPHGLATIGYDDDGVATTQWDLVRDGVLVGYQLDRTFAPRLRLDRSNGCAFADSPHHVPIQRMANVSLRPDRTRDTTLEDLIGGVGRGIYVVGDKSWSIDIQRYNFQFTASITVHDRLAGQLAEAFGLACDGSRTLSGFASHKVTTTWLDTSAGVRRRATLPTGSVELNAKTADLSRSAWGGLSIATSADFASLDLLAPDAELATRLGWGARRVDQPAGRYPTILPPSAIADLLTYLCWDMSGRPAQEGRSAFSAPSGSPSAPGPPGSVSG